MTAQLAPIRAGAFAAALSVLSPAASAQENPAAGVVFVRVIGTVVATLGDETGFNRRQIQLDDVQIASGSGLIVSPYGYIVTNNHVIAGGELRGYLRGVPTQFTLTVQRVQVRFAEQPGGAPSQAQYDASVVAADPDLDLAVLSIQGNDFSYVPFGDSDALEPGDHASVIGYPLGERLDIGRETSDEPAAPAMAAGIVSALRPDDVGNLRYIQTSAPLNRGNSGGPLVDRDGFAVGIVQLKLTTAEGIGFAIPINLVKDFLARFGLDTSLPSVRLTLGPTHEDPNELLRLRVPNGFDDAAPSRLRVDSGTSIPGISLRIDRVATNWTPEQLEDELRAGRAFESFASTSSDQSTRDGKTLRGESAGRADGRPFRMLSSILDLGSEKLVARYIGGAEAVAFNESVLAASLETLEAAAMNDAAAPPLGDAAWTRASTADGSVPVLIPPGWVADADGPMPCAGLRAPRASIVSAPRRDFTVSLRVAQHEARLEPARAAARCAGRNGTADGAEYRYQFSRFGIEYSVEGRFQTSANETLQLELVAPTRKFGPLREAFRRWLRELPTSQP